MTIAMLLKMAVVSLGTIQYGWNSGVINQPRDSITGEIPMSNLLWGVFVSMFHVGGIIGGFGGGHLASSFGRKNTLWVNNLLFISGGCFLYLAPSTLILCCGRFLTGLGAGVGTAVVPLYISELSPLGSRGSYGSINQLSIVIGALLSLVAGTYLSTPEHWRIMLLLTAAPASLQLLLLPLFLCESPRWLLSHGATDQDARKALVSVRSKATQDEIDSELRALLDAETSCSPNDKTTSLVALFSKRHLRIPLLAVFCLQFCQQLSGIKVYTYYVSG
ncbi:MAG: hypothetical protein SGCHY_000896 [Lobulomycetales sp.]